MCIMLNTECNEGKVGVVAHVNVVQSVCLVSYHTYKQTYTHNRELVHNAAEV